MTTQEQLLLRDEDLQYVLVAQFKNPAVKYMQAEFKSLTENLDGFLGDHFTVTIAYELAGQTCHINFFVKSKPTHNQVQLEMANELNAYEKEIFMYDVLLREYQRRNYDVSFAPKMLLCKDAHTLVLADLKTEGYILGGRSTFFDVHQVRSSLKALAQFHASSLLYEEDMSKELNRSYRLGEEYPTYFKENLLTLADPKTIGAEFFDTSLLTFLELIDLLPETEEWKTQCKLAIQKPNLLDIFLKNPAKYRRTVGHGDLWTNNMMFREENGIAVKCVLLDFQILRYCHPAFDVLLLLHTNTRRELRRQHQKALIDYYYDAFCDTLKDTEVLFTRADLQAGIEWYAYLSKYEATCAHTITFMDVDKLKDAVSGDLKSVMFTDRPKTGCEAFKLDPYYREVISEDLYELRDMAIDLNAM